MTTAGTGLDERLRRRNVAALRLEALLGAVLVPLFWVLDWIVVPDHAATTLVLRVASTLYAVALLVASARWQDWVRRHVDALAVGLTLLVAWSIAVMCWLHDGYASGYYAGINLVLISVGFLFAWPTWLSMLFVALVYGFYMAPLALGIVPASDLTTTISNQFFLVSTMVVMVAAQRHRYQLEGREYAASEALQRAKVSLEEAYRRAKDMERFRAQVFANITHELKTPLTMILASLELLEEIGSLTEEQRATAQAMSRNALKLLKMIGDILDLSKLDDSRIRLHVGEHELVAYLRGLMGQVEALAKRKGVALTFHAEVPRCPTFCDLERLERVFVNVLSNAAKFTPEGGEITTSLSADADHVLVEIADTGPGFPPEQAEALFERFHQVEMSSTRRYGGTGIGLALAKEFVELHGGRIWAENRPEGGAIFRVRLPRSEDHFAGGVLDRRTRRRSVAQGQRAGDRGLADWSAELTQRSDFRLLDIAEATERRLVQRHRHQEEHRHAVLAVDDVPDVLRVISLALQDHFRVYTAQDGLQGLALAKRLLPSLIVTDLMMPGIDGLQLIEELRADPATSQIPIIMLSARGDLDDRVQGLRAGANAYLPKPFSPRELRSAVGSLLHVQDLQTEAQLRRRLDGLDALAAGLSHEFNNALNQVRPALELLGRDAASLAEMMARAGAEPMTEVQLQRLDKLAGRVTRMHARADAGATRIARMVEFLGQYARAGYERHMERYDLFAAATDTIDVLLRSMGSTVAVQTDLSGDGTVECLQAEVLQAVTNLIQNGIEAAAEGGGHLRVCGRRSGDQVLLSVADDGPGVPPELRERVFDPFFTTKGPGGGTGLGLNIAWRVARRHGGAVELRSSEQGAEFVLRLPAAAPRPRTPVEGSVDTERAASTGSGRDRVDS